ncbi:MAG: AraC family transcriptional regulator [Pasteurellaceae bacterium]|nr:AraC family transcriptional regulator [Pasteurellaceae bacterium]
MDALSHLFHYFPFRTELFFIGNLCQIAHFESKNKGLLHFIRRGRCLFQLPNQTAKQINEPCVILSAEQPHYIHPLDDELEIFCIHFDFGENVFNPISYTMHNQVVILTLTEQPELGLIAQEIFREKEQQDCGFQAVIHHLIAYATLQTIRCCLKQKRIRTGILRGLTDKLLAPALLAIHQSPEQPWQLETLAEKALMSRSKFAAYFKNIMGLPPMEYVAQWRISVAQTLLLKNIPISLVAEKVGYSHNAAFTRAFLRIVGQPPSEWLKQQKSAS